ncbi:hypothetical protein GCM10023191_101840 [Actinoallomurus oryzae]|uniref:Sel1 repeat family protein n=1 Tax=Actinoallomurus oryzae TaxID=502180 RepID=A0ABP8R9M6_9ACTN
MASETPDRTLRDVYYAQILEYWDFCGTPSMRVIEKISKQLPELYGEQYRDLPSLSRTTAHGLIHGKRKGLPATDQTSSLILSLQRLAFMSGILSEDPGPAGLREWHDRLRRFRKLGADTPAQILEDRRPAHTGPTDSTILTEPAEQDDSPPAAPGAEHEQRQALTLTQQRFYDSFGPYGLTLLAAADDDHDPDAAYRVAVLLYLERHHPREALAWLTKALRSDHFGAARLNEADDPIQAAAEHAHRLASFAFAAGDSEVAQIFYERAARHGHAEAAFELGVLFTEADEPTRATYWFNVAAEGGHEYARSRFEDIHRTLLGETFAPPRPEGLSSMAYTDELFPIDDPEATPPFGLSAV